MYATNNFATTHETTVHCEFPRWNRPVCVREHRLKYYPRKLLVAENKNYQRFQRIEIQWALYRRARLSDSNCNLFQLEWKRTINRGAIYYAEITVFLCTVNYSLADLINSIGISLAVNTCTVV